MKRSILSLAIIATTVVGVKQVVIKSKASANLGYYATKDYNGAAQAVGTGVGGAALGAIGAYQGAALGAKIGWLGGPAGSAIGAVVGAGVGAL